MRTPVQQPFIGQVVFNRITRVLNPGGTVVLYGWEWAFDTMYTWVNEWL